ncbi:MAG: hypothetical protein GAK45_01896 [Pseudomonas citronellolis]|nr:MAG: hypothetical protein GAK45_01896 [Pseudomonas citronellolis]
MSQAVISPLRQRWLRWRFHLSALLILVPLGFMPAFLHDARMDRGLTGLGAREVGEVQVGPWQLRLAEWEEGDPEDEGRGGFLKAFSLALCEGCAPRIKAVYLRVGKPFSPAVPGALFSGNPNRLFTEVAIPPRPPADAQLWLTVDGWDGVQYQASLPLAQASPSLVAWIDRQGASR